MGQVVAHPFNLSRKRGDEYEKNSFMGGSFSDGIVSHGLCRVNG